MSVLASFSFFADRMIEIMGFGLTVALVFRYLAYRAGQRDRIYFKTFARGVEKTLQGDTDQRSVEDVDGWMTQLLVKVTSIIPDRSLRFGKFNSSQKEGSFRFQDKESLSEFAEGKKSIVHGVKQHIDIFKSPFPPNFPELTHKILDQDRQWKSVVGIPVDMLSRMLDTLPGLFIVGGILGTFVGIASGLPKVAAIDLNRINESAPVLTSFVESVAFSMETSIAGIIYSVLMTILNTLFPIHSSRVDVEKTLERCFELIWLRIHGGSMSYAERQNIRLLEKIHGELRKFNGDSEDKLREVS